MRLWTSPNSPHISWAQETRSFSDLWWCLMILLMASLSIVCTSVSSNWPAPAECKEVAGQGWFGGLAQFFTWEMKFKCLKLNLTNERAIIVGISPSLQSQQVQVHQAPGVQQDISQCSRRRSPCQASAHSGTWNSGQWTRFLPTKKIIKPTWREKTLEHKLKLFQAGQPYKTMLNKPVWGESCVVMAKTQGGDEAKVASPEWKMDHASWNLKHQELP